MAYPQRAAVATSNEPSNTTTHTITLPSGIVSGSLVLVFVGTDGDISWSNLNGFTELFSMDNGTAASLSVMYKYCTGSEGSTVDFISNESEVSTHISWRITGDAGSGRIPEVSTGVVANSQFPDPDLVTPTGGAKDYLFIAVEGNDDDDAVTAYPLPDNNATNIDSGGCGVGVCSDELNQASLNPGTFTLAGTEQWIACTVAVHPVGLTYKTLAGTIGSASSVPDSPLKRTREFVSVAVAGVSNIVDAPLKRLREFVGETVEGISSLIADIVVLGGGVVQALQGSIGAISGIADVPLKRIRRFIGKVWKELFADPGVEVWTDANNLTYWIKAEVGDGVLNRESTVVHEGSYSADCDITGGVGAVSIYEQNLVFEVGKEYGLTFWYRCTNGGSSVGYVSIRDQTDWWYLNGDGEWQSGSFQFNFTPAIADTWYKFTLPVPIVRKGAVNTYRIQFRGHLDGYHVYFDKFSLYEYNSQINGVLKRIRSFIGKLAGWEDSYEWVGGVPSFGQGKFEWVGGVLFGNMKYGEPKSGVSGTLKRVKAFIGNIGSTSGVEGIFTGVFKLIGTTVEGISSVLAAITVILGGGIQAFIGAVEGISGVLGNITGTFSFSGSVGAVSGIVDASLKRLRKFVGVSIDVVSSIIDVSLKRIRKFIGGVGSFSGVFGFFKVLKKFVGVTVEGISAVTGLFTTLGTVLLQGLVEGVSGVTGVVKGTFVFSGSAGEISGVDAVFKRIRKFIGETISNTSGVVGVLKRIRKFVGETVQGISSVLGNIQTGAIKAFIGTIGVISGVIGSIRGTFTFSGSVGEASGVSGIMKVVYKFTGVVIQGISSITGELSKLGTIMLSGMIGGISAVDGVLKATFSLKGDAEGLSGVTGLMKYAASFSGLVEALSGLTGTIVTSAAIVLQGVIGSFSAVVGDIKRSRGFIATISALSGVGAVMKRIRAYISSVNIFSGVNGILKRLRRLSGSILSTTVVDGYVKILYRFIGSIASASNITATLGRVKKFVGVTISAVSSVAGDLWAGVLYIFPIIFTVAPRIKAFLVEARDRIFKSNINKDR